MDVRVAFHYSFRVQCIAEIIDKRFHAWHSAYEIHASRLFTKIFVFRDTPAIKKTDKEKLKMMLLKILLGLTSARVHAIKSYDESEYIRCRCNTRVATDAENMSVTFGGEDRCIYPL